MNTVVMNNEMSDDAHSVGETPGGTREVRARVAWAGAGVAWLRGGLAQSGPRGGLVQPGAEG